MNTEKIGSEFINKNKINSQQEKSSSNSVLSKIISILQYCIITILAQFLAQLNEHFNFSYHSQAFVLVGFLISCQQIRYVTKQIKDKLNKPSTKDNDVLALIHWLGAQIEGNEEKNSFQNLVNKIYGVNPQL